jgi:hypothetical protein
MAARRIVFAVLVVLAGCSSAPVPDGQATPSGTPTATPSPTVDADNPWRETTLTVAVEAPPDDDREYTPMVREALDYWASVADRFAGYPISFEVVPAGEEPDLVVAFVDRVGRCENVTEVAGCAPHITSPSEVNRPERLAVRTGLSDASTVLVLKHEVGHVLGLGHEDPPQEVMAPTANLTTLPQPNATERELPWRTATLSVAVDYSTVPSSDRRAVREQIRHALTYYERGADGYGPGNVTFVTTDDRESADVVVTFPDATPCGDGGSGSCGSRFGIDPDGDGAVEWYTRLEIAVAGLDSDAVGWHVARWLGYGFGFDDAEDWPPVLRDATHEQRRGEWWNNDSAAAAPAPLAGPAASVEAVPLAGRG